MNELVQTSNLGGAIVPGWLVLAQADPSEVPTALTENLPPQLSWLNTQPGLIVIGAITAIATLIVGWIIAVIAASLTNALLNKTDLDNRIANMVSGTAEGPDAVPIEKWVSTFVFWVVMIFAIIAALNALQLENVSAPLQSFLDRIFSYLPQLGAAIAWVAGGWLLASVAKLILTRGLQAFNLDDRLNQAMGAEGEATPFLLNETLGNALYWFILLFFLYFGLGALGLQEQLVPIESLLTQILDALPKILTALVIGAVGWLIARVVRGIVTNLLATTGIDQLGGRVGLSQAEGRQNLSWVLGTVIYTIILILTAIAALEELDIEAISQPAIDMLGVALDAIPRIFSAIVILVVAYTIGQFVADLAVNILTGIGFNNVLSWLGFSSQTAPPPPSASEDPAATVIQEPATARTPSEIVGILVQVGIMLFAIVAAVNLLEFEELTALVAGLLVIFGRIIAGVVVFGVGLYLANLAFNLIASSNTPQSRILAQTARIVAIALISAMALQQIGIAPNIVNLAFGLVLGSIAVAVAIAFGLGGRDIASEQIREWLNAFKRRDS